MPKQAAPCWLIRLIWKGQHKFSMTGRMWRSLRLVHHGELDTRLVATWPAYDKALSAANVPHEGYIYPGAGHGFNCDATPERYNKAAADLAWQRTIDWFNKYMRG